VKQGKKEIKIKNYKETDLSNYKSKNRRNIKGVRKISKTDRKIFHPTLGFI